MSKINYLIGLIKHFPNKRISKFALIDNLSTFHKTAIIYRKVKAINSHLSAYTFVGPRTQLVHANIGKYCSIGPDCLIGLPRHSLKNISTSPIFTSRKNATKYSWTNQDTFQEFQQVTLGSDVWIGSRAIIMDGVRIGHGSVIGAGAIVTKDIPDYAIAVGVPARAIKYRFEEKIIKTLLEIKWWDMPEQTLKDNIQIFNMSEFKVEDLADTFKINHFL